MQFCELRFTPLSSMKNRWAREADRFGVSRRHPHDRWPTYWPTLLLLATAMRRAEILALRWRDVDFERGIVLVMESLEETRPTRGKAALGFKSTKPGKARILTLPAFG